MRSVEVKFELQGKSAERLRSFILRHGRLLRWLGIKISMAEVEYRVEPNDGYEWKQEPPTKRTIEKASWYSNESKS